MFVSCKFFSGAKNPENLEHMFLCFLVSFADKMFVSCKFFSGAKILKTWSKVSLILGIFR